MINDNDRQIAFMGVFRNYTTGQRYELLCWAHDVVSVTEKLKEICRANGHRLVNVVETATVDRKRQYRRKRRQKVYGVPVLASVLPLLKSITGC